MKIYKFKDLRVESDFPHLLQIIDENKIWCAAPQSLNDPDEFRFVMDYEPTEATEELLANIIEMLRASNFSSPSEAARHVVSDRKLKEFTEPEVEKMIDKCRYSIGVISFTMEGTDERLWKKYGGKGNGAVVELDVPDELIDDRYHIVKYVPERRFHVDTFLASQAAGGEEIFRKILCTKTRKWRKEREIRFLGKMPNVNVTLENPIESITSITIGGKVRSKHVEKLVSVSNKKNIEVKFK